MKIKTWIQEGEKTIAVLSSKKSAYTDRIIIVNEEKNRKKEVPKSHLISNITDINFSQML